jgi:hypothetical protein
VRCRAALESLNASCTDVIHEVGRRRLRRGCRLTPRPEQASQERAARAQLAQQLALTQAELEGERAEKSAGKQQVLEVGSDVPPNDR